MSEEILKALTQLFAIITKQDGGVTEKERRFVISYFQQELDQDSVKEYLALYDKFAEYNKEKDSSTDKPEKKSRKLTSVRDSVKTLAICKKINKTLTQKQKVVVLIKLLELVGADENYTPQRMEIIDTASTVFNIVKDEYKLIETFVLHSKNEGNYFDDILVLSPEPAHEDLNHVVADVDGSINFLRVESVDMYFVKYLGQKEVVLNGFVMKANQVFLFAPGSTMKTPKGDALYYSELISNFLHDKEIANISFDAHAIEFTFPNGGIGLRDINISEPQGRLIGIMGASGAGKTTLMNVLAGIDKPSSGSIKINGLDINQDKDDIQGVIGYVSQDDLLIEELTVFQNLYYNAKLCFADLSEEALRKRVMDVLTSLGLDQRKDLKVGSVLDKKISGGQRKRLNIALELIREPAVLFVDEPTSGLSSRDSENVIDLLKELSLRGKLIFVVIHQPSSDIYKMFDKMIILDTGGYPIFNGHPVEAVTYFKEVTNQVDAARGVCPTCGNVNPEQIFNIIEAQVVDEYGQFTNKRKITPPQWNEKFYENFKIERVPEVKNPPPIDLKLPNKLKQTLIFTVRDTLSKVSNRQYMLINLLEAPLLAFFLSFIIRYKSTTEASYVFRFNDNIPAFLLIAIIVALFMGLTVSAEEIIRDRKILKRESFLNLSWASYLNSKLIILFVLSAVQTLTFVLIGNGLLGIKEMTFSFWLALFSTSCFANVLGLNISSAFNSAVTVYILIPLLLIPQMVLSGLLFSYDKLNQAIGQRDQVPLVADFMASRWAYEAMAVYQFRYNSYQEPIYELERQKYSADYMVAYWVDQMRDKGRFINENYQKQDKPEVAQQVAANLALIRNEIADEPVKEGLVPELLDNLTVQGWSKERYSQFNTYVDAVYAHYLTQFNQAQEKIDQLIAVLENDSRYSYKLNEYKDRYYNESLGDLVRNINAEDRIIELNNRLVQQLDPVFKRPEPSNAADYRASFFVPEKYFAGKYFNTFYFNIVVIWLMTLILYIALYFEAFRKLISTLGKIKLSK